MTRLDLERSNVQILLVEDEDEYLLKGIDWLDRFGYQEISTARNAAQAKAKLDSKPFDVIVAEMRLDGDATGGFAVLDEVKKRNITSVVIVLTANDTVADSRRAFKEGAWDYLAKSMKGNVFEVLDQSILDAINSFNRRGNDKDKEWIEKNIEWLLDNYGGQYIAVINNQVIAAAETQEALKEQLREKKYPFYMPIIKKIEAKKRLEISELIERGESQTVEFKSTLGWDVRQKRVNKKLRFAILETIVAFMNSAGGHLVIGVADDGAILGLENDLSGKTPQGLKESLENEINARISMAFGLINVRFETIEGKDVCAVEIDQAPGPVFINGQRGIEFYIRVGNTTLAPRPEEMYDYIRTHWK
jgi:CheY-like chemotaxis protein